MYIYHLINIIMRTTTKKGNNKSVIVKNIKRKNNSYITFKKQNMYNQK